MKFEIFTDGAYSSARNQGGIGIVFVRNGEKILEFNKPIRNTTNNRCELLSVIIALNSISKPIESITIYTDSQYVIGCATKGWQRKKNKEYWKKYDEVYAKASSFCKNIEFVWVKGHTNKTDTFSKMNDLADRLAVEASQMIV